MFDSLFSEYTTTTVATKYHTLANYTTRRQFVKMKYGGVYLFGATMGNSSSNATWKLVKIYGGFDRSEYRNPDFQCCLNYKDGSDFSLAKVKPYKTRRFQSFSVVWSLHVTCPNVRYLQNAIPTGVSLAVGNHNCTKSEVNYIKPHLPLREAQAKVAIATKIAYGNISTELIIEWMEWYKLLEVDKVMAFYLKSLNEKSLKVLQYYASTGVLDLHLYEPAASGEPVWLNRVTPLIKCVLSVDR